MIAAMLTDLTDHEKWQRARRILCVRLDAIGDVLMTVPALRAVKGAANNRRITLLTSKSGAAVASLIGEIDEVIEYESPWMKATTTRDDSTRDWQMIDFIRRQKFDAAVIFTVYSQNPLPAALFCFFADIPLRLAHCRENPYQLLTDWAREIEPHETTRHEVQRQLDLVAGVGFAHDDKRMAVQIPDAAIQKVKALLRDLQIFDNRWAIVHCGATAASRRYAPEKFAVVVQKLVAEHNFRIVFTGTSDEARIVNQVQNLLPPLTKTDSLAGRLNLAELAALIKLAPVLISNNSSPVHFASATNTPVVDLYALTNPQHLPWLVPNRVLSFDVPCKYCYKSVCPLEHNDCLQKIEPLQIVEAAVELLTLSE